MSAPVKDDRDYLDKGLDAGLKKYGGAKFQDPNANRAKKEKITDFIRKQFEKLTGYVVPISAFFDYEVVYGKFLSADGVFFHSKKVPAKFSN